MKIVKTKDFEKEFAKLPSSIKKLFATQQKIFQKNWLDSRLHIKRVKELPGVYSIRVTRRYRALFYFDKDGNAIFFAIGHRKEIYRK